MLSVITARSFHVSPLFDILYLLCHCHHTFFRLFNHDLLQFFERVYNEYSEVFSAVPDIWLQSQAASDGVCPVGGRFPVSLHGLLFSELDISEKIAQQLWRLAPLTGLCHLPVYLSSVWLDGCPWLPWCGRGPWGTAVWAAPPGSCPDQTGC